MDSPVATVRATAVRSASGDAYTIIVRVSLQEPDASAASTRLEELWSTVEGGLEGLAARDLDVHRGPVSLNRNAWFDPQRDRQIVEWHAARQVTIVGRDDAAGVLAAFAPGTGQRDGLEIQGPHWRLDDDNEIYGQTLAEAVGAARRRAEQYATAAGGTLGRLIEIGDFVSSSRDIVPLGAIRATSAMSGGISGMSFESEQIEVTATVEGRWLIELP